VGRFSSLASSPPSTTSTGPAQEARTGSTSNAVLLLPSSVFVLLSPYRDGESARRRLLLTELAPAPI
jgi:hypothetical protein